MGNKIFNTLLGKVVRIDRGGPESRVGQIIAVKQDYFALLTEEEGLVFYQPQHIKSITQTINRELVFKSDFLSRFRFMPPENFHSVLKSLLNFNVKINRGGKESVEGLLVDVDEGFVTVMTNNELVRITLFHVRNISLNKKQGNQGEENRESSSSRSSSKSGPKSRSRRR